MRTNACGVAGERQAGGRSRVRKPIDPMLLCRVLRHARLAASLDSLLLGRICACVVAKYVSTRPQSERIAALWPPSVVARVVAARAAVGRAGGYVGYGRFLKL